MEQQTKRPLFFALVLMCSLVSTVTYASIRSLDLSKGESRVEFLAVGKPSMIKIKGKGGPLAGKLNIDGPKVSGLIDIALATFDTGIELRNSHMKEKYLHIDKYPKAQLTLSKVNLPQDWNSKANLSDVDFDGLLKLHGVEKPVSGKLSLTKLENKIDGKALFKFKISDFGIDVPSYAGIKVTDEVSVESSFKAALE